MSVLIKGMQMPKNCIGCVMVVGTFCQVLSIDVDPWYDGSVKRNDNCPLVELPEHHGKLIDADALVAESLMDGAYGYVDTKEIYDAPTIVEAEGVN